MKPWSRYWQLRLGRWTGLSIVTGGEPAAFGVTTDDNFVDDRTFVCLGLGYVSFGFWIAP